MSRITLNSMTGIAAVLAYLSISLFAQPVVQLLNDEAPDVEAMQQEMDEFRREGKELREKANQQLIALPEYEDRRNRLYGRLMELRMRANLGTFLLDGIVVDENGIPIDGVDLTVVKSIDTGIESSTSKTQKHEINGVFSVQARGYTAVALIFSKAGHYQAHLRFPQLTLAEMEALAAEFDNGRIRPKNYEHRNLRVEMHSVGELARTLSLGYQPRFRIMSDGQFLELRSFKTIPQPGTMNVYFLPEQRVQLRVEEIPESAIYIKPALDRSGRIVPLDEDPRYSRFPSEITLILNADEGGFLLHEGGSPEKGFWFMEEAPEDGYQRELKINGQFLYDRLNIRGGFSGVYFYFKVGDMYGKARLNSIGIIDSGNTLRSNIQMFFQPDGTRFLRTARGLRE